MSLSVKVTIFKVDNALAYSIQQITKDSSQEILTYFYGIASFVIDDLVKTSTAYFIDKSIVLFYKETALCYRLHISGLGPKKVIQYGRNTANFAINVSYPRESSNFDVTNLLNAAVETGLGLNSEQSTIPPFNRPQLKTPRCLKSIRQAQAKAHDNINFPEDSQEEVLT